MCSCVIMEERWRTRERGEPGVCAGEGKSGDAYLSWKDPLNILLSCDATLLCIPVV